MWQDFARTSPRPVENGLRVRVPDGRQKTSWWASRWIGALDSFGWSNRLQRGRSYARRGQVIDFEMVSGKVAAKVQGSRPRPYTVKISLEAFSASQWDSALQAMAGQASFAAGLLAGDMPEAIETIFTAVGLALLPARGGELKTECSCPDYANPCKHVAAVHYVLASEFDRDPFLIFALRGRSRQQVLEALRQARAGQAPPEVPVAGPKPRTEPSVEGFWTVPSEASLTVALSAPAEDALLLFQLGSPPFWDGSGSLADALAPVYRAASTAALRWAYGDASSVKG